MINCQIKGTGSYLPERVLTNKDLESMVDTSSEWILDRVGIQERHIAADEEMASHMATKAALRAMEAAGVTAEDIDYIVVGSCTGDYIFPSVACYVQKALGVKACPAFDVAAACSGFIYAMDLARQSIQSGSSKVALVIGVEVMSRIVDWEDRNTCVLFGDGAGAAVLTQSEQPGILYTHMSADGSYENLLNAPSCLPGQHQNVTKQVVHMAGKEVFKIAVNTLGRLVQETLSKNGLTQDDIDWLIPHQANTRIIEATARKLGMPMERVVVTLPNQGNTSSASIPLALDHAVRQGMVKPGQLLLLETFGGGLTWGAALVRYL